MYCNATIAYRSTKCYQNEKIIHIVSYSSKHHKLFKFTSYQAVKMKGKNVEINFPGRVRSWIMDVAGCCHQMSLMSTLLDTVASCTSSGAHDLNFGLGLLKWV